MPEIHGPGCIDRLEAEATGHTHKYHEDEVRWCYECNDIETKACRRSSTHRQQMANENIRSCACGKRQIADGTDWITVSSGPDPCDVR